MRILAFPDYLEQSKRLAAILNIGMDALEVHHFPDGESLVRLPSDLSEHLLICCSLNQANHKLIELMLCAETARKSGVRRLTLIAPYLCYMRQDIANRPGEAVSQQIIGRLLAKLFDDVITVDPHLHRIERLDQAIPLKNAICLTAAQPIAQFLARRFQQAVLIGPDVESEQWVRVIAEQIGFSYAVAHKVRQGDTQLQMTLPDYSFTDRDVVIVDDMASTGRTLALACGLLKQQGAASVNAVITHALFCGDAEQVILNAGLAEVWSTDSISHSSACIELGSLLADAVLALDKRV
jgi:ribose-phosphate pyrophosphokinase